MYMAKKIIIGVTGKSGVGKTEFCNALIQSLKHAKIINVDQVFLDVVQNPSYSRHVIQANNNGLDAKKRLNSLQKIFTEVERRVNQEIRIRKGPLLIEHMSLENWSFTQKCDIKILIEADENLRQEKLYKRDLFEETDFCREKLNNSESCNFDYKFFNDYSQEALNKMINQVLPKIK